MRIKTLFLSVALENRFPFESIYLAETVLPCFMSATYTHSLLQCICSEQNAEKTVLKDKYDCLTPTSKLA